MGSTIKPTISTIQAKLGKYINYAIITLLKISVQILIKIRYNLLKIYIFLSIIMVKYFFKKTKFK